jgi:hypothetical protein
MLTQYDDFPIHQTPEPVAHPSTSDLNFYDRYFFNGFSPDGELYFGAALGLYPNRRVQDASLSVVRDGRQVSLHASRLAAGERAETRVGPVRVEVLDPMRTLRLVAEPNETGVACDLVFRARSAAVEEPPMLLASQGRVMMNSTRFTQFGAWEGSVEVEGSRIEVTPDRIVGVRDRSWGIRPVGERVAAAPGPPPQFFWLWSPILFQDRCTLFGVVEDGTGRVKHANGALLRRHTSSEGIAVTEKAAVEHSLAVRHRVRWQPGTRRSSSAEIELVQPGGEPLVISLEPFLTFQMLGLGYTHFEWGHGMWKGENALAGESWKLDGLDPLDPRHIHVQQLCRARLGDEEGIGCFEQLVIGVHEPSGFEGLFDGSA